LSPDGKYLVGPYGAANDPQLEPTQNQLYVWKQNEDHPHKRLLMPGPVIWLGFVAKDRLAVRTFSPAPVLQIWDLGSGELKHTFKLPGGQFPPPVTTMEHSRAIQSYRPVPLGGAVSQTGKYVALGGPTGVTLVSVADIKVVGTLPMPQLAT